MRYLHRVSGQGAWRQSAESDVEMQYGVFYDGTLSCFMLTLPWKFKAAPTIVQPAAVGTR